MKQGCYFGYAGLLFKAAHPERVRCKTDCVLYHSKNEEMEKLLEDFPLIRENMLCVAGKPAPMLRQEGGLQSRRKGSMITSGVYATAAASHKLKATLRRVRASPIAKKPLSPPGFGARGRTPDVGAATTASSKVEQAAKGLEVMDAEDEHEDHFEASHVVSSPASHAEVKRAMALKMAALSAFGNSVKIVKTPNKSARSKSATTD